jgi:Zn finger protein HypA/HybF involved in hydrogenase expression
MKLELVKHGEKVAEYRFVAENPAEEKALKTLFDREKFPVREYGGKMLRFIRSDYALHDIKALERVGEITVGEVREEVKEYLACSECGSKNVQVKAWVYPNDSNRYAGETDDGEAWCEDCDEHVSLDYIKRINKSSTKKINKL